MARPLRIEFPNALFHVTSRGDRREDIYHDDQDREIWLEVMAQVCNRFKWRVYAYCLMSNHFHILLQTPHANLSAGMRQLNGVYTQAVNRRHSRVGHVFQGRFKAVLVDQEAYLLEVARYVVLNPIRASMVSDVADWKWSSYGATVGDAPGQAWLAVDALLEHFSTQRGPARRRYQDHVRAGVGLPSIWAHLNQQIYLGDESFIKRTQKKLTKGDKPSAQKATVSDTIEIPKTQRLKPAKSLSQYEERNKGNRNAAMYEAFRSGAYTQAQIAQHFGLHYTTVSRLLTQIERLARD